MLASIITLLHQKAIQLYPYLGDMLIVATSQVKMKYTIDNTLQTLQKAGFINNVKKSHLIMTQQLPFLGMNLDSSTAKVFLPMLRAQELQKCTQLMLPAGAYKPARLEGDTNLSQCSVAETEYGFTAKQKL